MERCIIVGGVQCNRQGAGGLLYAGLNPGVQE